MPEAGKFYVGDYVSIPGRVVKTDYVGQWLDRCVKVETKTGTQEWFRADDLAHGWWRGQPVFERGFYRLARDLDVAEDRVAAAGATVAIVGEQTDEHAHLWLVMPSSGVKWTCTAAALAAAGAERVEDR